MMASPRRLHRRSSIEHPPNMLSDVIHLKEELNRLHQDISPEFQKHVKTMTDLINEFERDYRWACYMSIVGAKLGQCGLAVMFAGLALFLYDEEVSAFVAAAGGAVAVVGGITVAFSRYRKTQQEKNLKHVTEEEMKGIQEKCTLIIGLVQKICQRTEELLRDPSLSDVKAQALSEHFTKCFEKRQIFQEQDRSKEGDEMSKIMHLSRDLSEMIAKVCSVPDILKEIMEDDKRQNYKPAKPTRGQINTMDFEEKAEKFINEMRKGICQMKTAVKELKQTSDRITKIYHST